MSFINFPTPTPVFPVLPPQAYAQHKKPFYKTGTVTNISGQPMKWNRMVYPDWEFTLNFGNDSSWLRDQTQNITAYQPLLGYTEFQQLSGLFVMCLGSYGEFYYSDVDDSSRSNQPQGSTITGQRAYRLFYQWGNGPFRPPLSLPVPGINVLDAVYLDGVVQSGVTIDPSRQFFILDTAPAGGKVITADFSFYYRCRFLDDLEEYEMWAYNLTQNNELKFKTVKPGGVSPYNNASGTYNPGAPAGGLWYFEVTVNTLHGHFYGGPSEFEIGFGNSDFSLYNSTATNPSDGGYNFLGSMAGLDSNSFGLYRAAFLGTGYFSFGIQKFGGYGIYYTSGHTYGFAVDLNNGDFFWRDVTSGGGWTGNPTNHNSAQNSGGIAGSVNGYDITGFGTSSIGILITSAYFSGYAGDPAGANSATLNTGASAFAGTVPTGWSPWDSSGATVLVVDVAGTCTLTGGDLTASWNGVSTIASGAISSSVRVIL